MGSSDLSQLDKKSLSSVRVCLCHNQPDKKFFFGASLPMPQSMLLFDLKRLSSISSCAGQEQSHENLLFLGRFCKSYIRRGAEISLATNQSCICVKNNPTLLNLVIISFS